MRISRRTILKGTALTAVSAVTGALPSFAATQVISDDQFHGLKVGICSYSLRAFPLDQVLAGAQRLVVRYISLKDVHLPLSSSAQQRRQLRQQAQDAGLSITSCGVIYLKNDADQMRQALDYVRDLGAGIAVVGVSREMLPILDRVIKDYDLKAAIHNHGPNDKLFPSPLEVYQAIQPFDRKIGVCMDIGHTFRMHENLLSDVTKTADRLYSMHFKDLDSDKIDAKGVPVGTGVLPVIPLLRELLHLPYSGEVQLEYEVEAKDPLPGMAESLGFMRGSLRTMS